VLSEIIRRTCGVCINITRGDLRRHFKAEPKLTQKVNMDNESYGIMNDDNRFVPKVFIRGTGPSKLTPVKRQQTINNCRQFSFNMEIKTLCSFHIVVFMMTSSLRITIRGTRKGEINSELIFVNYFLLLLFTTNFCFPH